MTWQKFMENHFSRLVFIFWFTSLFVVIFLLGQLDHIIHGDLYDFGLEFSSVWATPYWVTLRLIYVWLIGPSVLGAIAFGFDFWKKTNGNANDNKNGNNKISKQKGVAKAGQVARINGNHVVISCPACKKTFGRPLVMLDFGGGKDKLVSVCPYCNTKLGDGFQKEKEDIEFGVLQLDKKMKTNSTK